MFNSSIKRKYNTDNTNNTKNKDNIENTNKRNKLNDKSILNEIRQFFTLYNTIIKILKSENEEDKYNIRIKYSSEELKKLYLEYDEIKKIYDNYVLLFYNKEYTYTKYSIGCQYIQFSLEFNKCNDIEKEIQNIIIFHCKKIDDFKKNKKPSISDKVKILFEEYKLIHKLNSLCRNTEINYILYFKAFGIFLNLDNILEDIYKIMDEIKEQINYEKIEHRFIKKETIDYIPNLWDKIKANFGYQIQLTEVIEKYYYIRYLF
jgi:hypothetical protein